MHCTTQDDHMEITLAALQQIHVSFDKSPLAFFCVEGFEHLEPHFFEDDLYFNVENSIGLAMITIFYDKPSYYLE